MGRTRTTTRTGRTRSDCRSRRRSAGRRRASLAPACDLLGISARTVGRWRADPEIGDRRCGPQHRPSNALAPVEEAQVVTVLTVRAMPACRRSSWFLSLPMKGCTSRPNRPCTGCTPTRSAHEAADDGMYTCNSRLHSPSGDWSEPGMELGHHLAAHHVAWSVPVALPDHRRLEPSHRWLADRRTRNGGRRCYAHSPNLRRRQRRPARPGTALRQWQGDARQHR